MPASNKGETARALASLSDPAGEIGNRGIPVVRRSEMMAVPLLESSNAGPDCNLLHGHTPDSYLT